MPQAPFSVLAAPNTTRATRPRAGAGAHRARLEGDHQRGAVEPPRTPLGGGRPQGEHLGVGGRVAVALPPVAGASHQLTVDQHGAPIGTSPADRRSPPRAPPPSPRRRPRRRTLPAEFAARGRASAWPDGLGPSGHGRPERRAEGVGFEPTVGCPTHAFQACRFGRSRTPPRDHPEVVPRVDEAIVSPGPLSHVAVGSCATAAREPSQGREAAALSGTCGVPQIA